MIYGGNHNDYYIKYYVGNTGNKFSKLRITMHFPRMESSASLHELRNGLVLPTTPATAIQIGFTSIIHYTVFNNKSCHCLILFNCKM